MLDTSILAFLAGAAVTALCAPLVRMASERAGIVDNPANDSLKVHRRPMCNLGGLAVGAGFFVAAVASAAAVQLRLALAFAVLALTFGSIDDIWWQKRSKLNLSIKITLQVILAVVSVFVLAPTPGTMVAAVTAGIITVLLINAINMQDGLDGLLSSTALVSSLGFLAVTLSRGDVLGATASAALAGCMIGFLTANYPPATIFLGDSGSYCIGAVFAFLAWRIGEFPGGISWWGVALLLGMPIANLLFVMVRRVSLGQSPLVGDRAHVYDLINQKTGSVPLTLALSGAMHTVLVLLGLSILL